MSKNSRYVSHQPDHNGYIDWPAEEHQRWQALVERQLQLLPGRACDEYMQGLQLLGLSNERIPQLSEINQVLGQTTGWQVTQVPALIDFDHFFRLLADKQFPVATFIRSQHEFEYLQEPDIFHEVFGHCPLLTNPAFAHFTHTYGKLGLHASKQERVFLARLYWFTVEFGLVNTVDGVRIYGGGILSSPGETLHALDTRACQHRPLDPLAVLRTPYRIDIMQPLYYVLNAFDDLFCLTELNMPALIEQAKQAGLLPALFPAKNSLAS